MKAEIITIGTELLMGNTIDTNSAFISKQLEHIGIGTYYKQTVGDNIERINEALEIATGRSECIILCGGIGPTKDDITKEAVARFLDQDLLLDENQVQNISNYYERKGQSMSENDLKQASYIKNGKIIPNDCGLALGTYLERKFKGRSQVIIILPGPPTELAMMVQRYIIDLLKDTFLVQQTIKSEYLNFTSIGEAQLASRIDNVIEKQTNPTLAIYAHPPLTMVRVTAMAESEEKADDLIAKVTNKIMDRLNTYFIGLGENMTIESQIINLLKKREKTLSSAESLTGGKVLSSLTSIPGAGDVIIGGFVTYQTTSKTKLLQIPQELIAKNTVVSAQVAREMAERTLKETQSDYAISLTGVAGPSELEGHKVGEVYIGLAAYGEETMVKHFQFGVLDREMIRDKAKYEALMMVLDKINK